MIRRLVVLDSHVHVWELTRRPQPWIDPATMPILDRDHLLETLEDELRQAGVDGALLVQVLNDPYETDDFLWLGASGWISGVVGWVDLLSPDVGQRLDALLAHPSGTRLVGIRHQALVEADPAGWLARAGECGAVRALGDRGLVFDLMLRPEHLATACDVVRRHQATSFVLDHAGKAPVAAGWGSEEAQCWADLISELGGLHNLACKLSGLTTMAPVETWTVADLRPFVDHLLDTFGPDRLMFGSDWPVSLRAGAYTRTLDAVRELTSELSREDQGAILGRTAQGVYGLAPAAAR